MTDRRTDTRTTRHTLMHSIAWQLAQIGSGAYAIRFHHSNDVIKGGLQVGTGSSLPAHMVMPVLSFSSTCRRGMSLDRGMPLMSDMVKRTKSNRSAAPSTQPASSTSCDAIEICYTVTLTSHVTI